MIFYMVRKKGTDLWFKRGGYNFEWTTKVGASAWTTPDGPRAAKGTITRYNRKLIKFSKEPIEVEVIAFNASESEEESFDNGYKKGYEIGCRDGFDDGWEAGREEGYENGYEDGVNSGE